ncbi:MAG: transglutaminase [Methanobacteriaceae archaeon]|jgi:hypothetical protein|nr:transglutaminase [Methanobacteriaceae archaeon]
MNINLIPGSYTISASFDGDEEYSSFTVNNLISVLSTISGKNITKYYLNDTYYYATIYDGNGNPLANTNVTMNINGVFYTRTTDGNGVVKLSINLFPNEYILTVIHPITGLTMSNKVSVLPTVEGKNIVKHYRNGTHYYATIVDNNGNRLVNTDVTMNINGVFYTRTTDGNGIVKLSINLFPGEYILTVMHPIDKLMMSNKVTVLMVETVIDASDLTVVYQSANNYSIIFKDNNGNPIVDLPVYFQLNNNKYYVSTDKKGVASLLLDLPVGEYSINYGFDGDSGYSSVKGENIIKIINSTSSLTGNNMEMVYDDGSHFNVKLLDLNGNPLINKTISFVINNVIYNRNTNQSGIASILISLYPGTYEIAYSYSSPNSFDYNKGNNNITIKKQTLNLKGHNLVMLPEDDSTFDVLLTKNGNPIANKNIVFTINGVSYTRTTNALGIASLKISLNVGYYTVNYNLADDLVFTAKQGQNTLLVNGTIFTSYPDSFKAGESFNALLTDAYGNPISNETIKFNVNNVDYIRKTNNQGIASINLNLNPGEYLIVYSLINSSKYPENNGQTTVKILNPIDFNSIIATATDVKNYIINNQELPSSVTINGNSYSIGEFLYLLSVTTKNINEGNFGEINSLVVSGPADYNKASNLGDLYTADYLSLALNIINLMSSNKQAPGFMDSALGQISFDGLVYAFARIVSFYGENSVLPAYVSIKSLEVTVPSSPLNDVNTISDLSPYLQATTNCQVNDPAIQAKAAELTAGLTNDLAKATAIFNFARDQIAYSFYYDTKFGAVGTLNRGYGNCVDGSHLVIALARAAGLPARYVHGNCRFSTFSTGHVWAQILIGDTWVVADSSSQRNSLGSVVNWNNYNYSLKGKYVSISF